MLHPFWQLHSKLKRSQFVDLTHAFHPGIPHGAGFDDEVRDTLFDHTPGVGSKGDGFLVHKHTIVGQWGTHVDPPIHFVDGGRALDDIPVADMVLPLCVIDCTQQAQQDADFTLSVSDLLNWEAEHGPLPDGAFVAMRTGWSKRWPDAAKMRPLDASGCPRFPGWGCEALKFLAQERNVTAIGHETTDTDPGVKAGRGDFEAEALWLAYDKYQIELLTGLDLVPHAGALIVASFPKVKGGSGFPARAFAICPKVSPP